MANHINDKVSGAFEHTAQSSSQHTVWRHRHCQEPQLLLGFRARGPRLLLALLLPATLLPATLLPAMLLPALLLLLCSIVAGNLVHQHRQAQRVRPAEHIGPGKLLPGQAAHKPEARG